MSTRIVTIPAFLLDFPNILGLYIAANSAWRLFRTGYKAIALSLDDRINGYYSGSRLTVTFKSTVDFGKDTAQFLKERNKKKLGRFDLIGISVS